MQGVLGPDLEENTALVTSDYERSRSSVEELITKLKRTDEF